MQQSPHRHHPLRLLFCVFCVGALCSYVVESFPFITAALDVQTQSTSGSAVARSVNCWLLTSTAAIRVCLLLGPTPVNTASTTPPSGHTNLRSQLGLRAGAALEHLLSALSQSRTEDFEYQHTLSMANVDSSGILPGTCDNTIGRVLRLAGGGYYPTTYDAPSSNGQSTAEQSSVSNYSTTSQTVHKGCKSLTGRPSDSRGVGVRNATAGGSARARATKHRHLVAETVDSALQEFMLTHNHGDFMQTIQVMAGV